jgi:methylenetetrahydrofolate dehydrogenase (NADP+)/methenyltetrahydrofolate cyclohydrolase
MMIDGKAIAENILQKLKTDIASLESPPTLAVVLVGDDPASLAYIKQKQKAASAIGARVILSSQPPSISQEQLDHLVDGFNTDATVNGVIVQRPLPNTLKAPPIASHKDVDGFMPNSPFPVPVAAATVAILRVQKNLDEDVFLPWLTSQNIVVAGRGVTAGAPIYEHLKALGCTVLQIHSQTKKPLEIMKQADILISCVGKKRVIKSEDIKTGVLLISIGIWRDKAGKLHGDYDDVDIADKASAYTPTPGGVGPVNVACLMQNLLKACTI